jgi:hypothetical protein
MKKKPEKRLEKYRVKKGAFGSDRSCGNNGVFLIPYKRDIILKVIVSDGMGWDHVSVSMPTITPTWSMMCYVKDLFFEEDEIAVQYHPIKDDYVNCHKNCLHMWRIQTDAIPIPPTWMVGPK